MNKSVSSNIHKNQKITQGKWTRAENDRFMKALQKYGRNWPLVQKKVKTRNVIQVRSHAQKIFQNMKKQDVDALIGGNDDTEESNDDLSIVGHFSKQDFSRKLKNKSRQEQNKKSLVQTLKDQVSKNSQTLLEVNNQKVSKISDQGQTQIRKEQNWSMFMKLWYQNQNYFRYGGDFLFLTPYINDQLCNNLKDVKICEQNRIPINLQ